MKLKPLPDEVTHPLDTLDAPPRLIAHLRLVHDVASMKQLLTSMLGGEFAGK